MRYVIKHIGVETRVGHHPFVKKALTRLENLTKLAPSNEIRGDEFSKDHLNFVHYPGKFLKPCPGTTGHICCGYLILNVATGCPMDCSYCILQSYFNQPGLRVFGNIEEGLDSVLRQIDSQPNRVFRIGTGEFTDSLALDPILGWSELLTPHFNKRKNAILELKTKTDHIKGLLRTGLRDRIVVSWSLNSPTICSKEEHGAASLSMRLEAARRCQKEGFAIGFHFDPLVHYPGWQDDYLRTVDLLDKYVEPKGIIWVSLGSLRFMPSLKLIMRKRHPSSRLVTGEFVTGKDGKMRYFKPIRVELYSFLKERLDAWNPDSGLYMCMESDDIWKQVFGWSPQDSKGLASYLDQRVRRIFG